MANRPVYCTEAAVRTHLGQLKLAVGVEVESLVESAANELDGLLGQRYLVPITVSPNIEAEKVTAYWLQTVSAQIAAGRYLVSAAAPGSQDTTNNYGKYLLSNAYAQIKLVVDGKRDLAGAEETAEDGNDDPGPFVVNGDRYSQVDAFYDNFEPYGFIDGREPRGAKWPQ